MPKSILVPKTADAYKTDKMKNRHAFTLIEMLVVIAIIGIVASLVVNMNGRAKYAQHKSQVDGEKAKIILAIGDYQSKLNFYPPDNGFLTNIPNLSTPQNVAQYGAYTSSNPLLYELTGLTNNTTSQPTVAVDGSNFASISSDYQNVFDRANVNNSNPDEPHSFFSPKLSEYTNYNLPQKDIKGLLVPVPGNPNPAVLNFWHYDASSPFRHNLQSYDLWAEWISGTSGGIPIIATNGNW